MKEELVLLIFLKEVSWSRDFCCWPNSLFQGLGPRYIVTHLYCSLMHGRLLEICNNHQRPNAFVL